MMNRIPRLDVAEEQRIRANAKEENPKDVFVFNGIPVADPYMSECGRFSILDPYEYYGSSYIVWYLSVPQQYNEIITTPIHAPSLKVAY